MVNRVICFFLYTVDSYHLLLKPLNKLRRLLILTQVNRIDECRERGGNSASGGKAEIESKDEQNVG